MLTFATLDHHKIAIVSYIHLLGHSWFLLPFPLIGSCSFYMRNFSNQHI